MNTQELCEFSLFLISEGITGYDYRKAMWEVQFNDEVINALYDYSSE